MKVIGNCMEGRPEWEGLDGNVQEPCYMPALEILPLIFHSGCRE